MVIDLLRAGRPLRIALTRSARVSVTPDKVEDPPVPEGPAPVAPDGRGR